MFQSYILVSEVLSKILPIFPVNYNNTIKIYLPRAKESILPNHGKCRNLSYQRIQLHQEQFGFLKQKNRNIFVYITAMYKICNTHTTIEICQFLTYSFSWNNDRHCGVLVTIWLLIRLHSFLWGSEVILYLWVDYWFIAC